MRILRVTTAYPDYLHRYSARHGQLASAPFREQEAAFYADAFGWSNFMSRAVARCGHEMWDVTLNMDPVQRAWAAENMGDAPAPSREDIVCRQAASWRPDVLFYDHYDTVLLDRIRAALPGLRLVVSWTGSAMPPLAAFAGCDLVLSCAPEAVGLLRGAGLAAEHIHHGFEPSLLDGLGHPGGDAPASRRPEVFFSGQILLRSEFHRARHELLATLHRRGAALRVYTDSLRRNVRPWRLVREYLRWLTYSAGAGRWLDGRPGLLPKVGRYRGGGTPRDWLGIPPYRDCLAPPVYGMDMYRTLATSLVALNVHADSSPRCASNMRLFEITGAGACLLTDQKANLGELFTPDREVITYDSAEDCAEKALWLLAHPARCIEIGQAGQARTLRDHSFDARAPQFLDLIGRYLR